MVELLLDLPAIGHRLLGIREQEGAGHEWLTELTQQGPHDRVVRDANADGPFLGVRQPPRDLLGRRENERVWTGSCRLDGTECGVVQLDEVAELGKIRAHEGEVVPVVQTPEPADALTCAQVAQLAAQGIARVGWVGDERVIPQQGHDLGDAVWLRILRVDVKVPGHASSLPLILKGVSKLTIPLPESLNEIAQDFTALSARDRLTLLLEFSDGLPELPERYQGHVELLERVEECQSPLFLVVEVHSAQDPVASHDAAGSQDEVTAQRHRVRLSATVRLFFQAPPEAPTTRGFAGILHDGLDGLTVGEVLAVPEDAPYRFGLGEAVSPLRLRGMVAMLSRIKRQTRLKSAVR